MKASRAANDTAREPVEDTLSMSTLIAAGYVRVVDGDLVLRAPEGRIVIEAGTNVEIRARRMHLESEDVDVTARKASVRVGDATILADAIRTTADEVASHVGRWELRAKRLVEHASVAVRDHRVLHTTVDRMRVLARDAIQLLAKRTSIVSEEDTTIDGKRVLLG